MKTGCPIIPLSISGSEILEAHFPKDRSTRYRNVRQTDHSGELTRKREKKLEIIRKIFC